MVTQYPGDFDTDVQIPRVDDNISEIGGEAINGLRDAVFAIQKALGLDPQGTAADLVARLAVALDDNGNLKASALAAAGLVSLPIDNSQIAATAGIEESKLDLDHSTVSLKTTLDSLAVLVASINAALIKDIGNLAQHVVHPGVFGRHRASDVDVVGGSFDGYTVKGAVDDLDGRLVAHITDAVDAHDASAISLVTTAFQTITDDNVQDAIETLEKLELTELKKHRDNQHGNGILQTQDAFTPGTNRGPVIIASASISSVAKGDDFIKFSVAPAGALFNSIVRNDLVEVTISGQVFVFAVNNTESTNQVNFFGRMPVAGTGTAIVYRNPEESDAPSVLAMGVRKTRISARPAVLQLVHPAAPFLLSNGFQGEKLSAGRKNFKILFTDGDTGTIDLNTLMTAFSARPSTWTVENVARILNEEVFAPGGNVTHFPLIAFADGGELGIALDEPLSDGYVEIGTVSSTDATDILGFTQGDRAVTRHQRNLYIDGYEITGGMRKILDAYGTILTTDTIQVLSKDLIAIGLKAGDLIRVDGPGIRTGTYVAENVTASLIEFDGVNELDFGAGNLGKGLQVRAYSDSFVLPNAPTDRILYEFFVDGYAELPFAEFHSTVRATYEDTTGGGASLEGVLDLVAVSRGFKESAKRLFYDFSALTVELGNPVGGPSITDVGAAVSMPTPAPGPAEAGFRFRMFDDYGIEYVDMEVVGALPNTDGYLDINVESRISEERFIQVATAIHDRTDFKRLDDRRLFGTVGRKDVRDDFTRDFVSYPTSVLRGTGIIYGLLIDGYNSLGFFDVQGGQVLVDGSLKLIQKTRVEIPADGEVATYNLFVDREGSLLFQRDDFHSTNILTTQSAEELISSNTEVLLAQVDVNASDQILEIRDLRRFIGNIDNRIDLLVEENNITHGSFASLNAAVNWINIQDSGNLPTPRTIKIRGTVPYSLSSGALTLPAGVSLAGDSFSRSASTTLPTIQLSGTGTKFLTPGDGCLIRNLVIEMATGSGVDAVIGDSGTDLTNLTLENCRFEGIRNTSGFARIIDSNNLSNLTISNCDFNFFSGLGAIGAVVLDSTSGMLDVFMLNCTVNLTSTGSNFFANAAADMENMFISHCVVDFPAAPTQAVGFFLFGSVALKKSFFDRCVFNFGTPSASGRGIFVNSAEEVIISNCQFRYATQGVFNEGMRFTSMTGCQIRGCIFENTNVGVTVSSDGYNFAIVDNIFDEVGQNGVDLTNAGHLFIRGNYMSKSDATVSADSFIKLTDGFWTTITGNHLTCSSTSAVNGEMIRIANTSNEITITDNFLLNTLAVNQGFKMGVRLDGAGGTVATDHIFTTMSGNRLFNFLGPSGPSPTSRGISVKNASNIALIGNRVNNCSFPFDGYDCEYLHVHDNFFGAEFFITDSNAFRLDGSLPTKNEVLVFLTNNTFFCYNVIAAVRGVVLLKNLATGLLGFFESLGGIVSNNIFIHFTKSSAFPILEIDGTSDKWTVTGNLFWTSFNGLPVEYSVEPMKIDGNSCLVGLNNLKHLTLLSTGAISLGGTGSTDVLNKGQTYIVPLSVADATYLESATLFMAFGVSDLPNQLRFTAAGDAFIPFGQYIPVGSTITKLVVGYNSGAAGAATDLEFRWLRTTEPTGLTGLPVVLSSVVTTIADGVDHTATITADLLPANAVMSNGDFHYLHIDVDAAGAGNQKNIYGMEIHYTI